MTNVYNFINTLISINNYEKIISIKVGLSYKVLDIKILLGVTKLNVTLVLIRISLFFMVTTSFSKYIIVDCGIPQSLICLTFKPLGFYIFLQCEKINVTKQ